MVRLRNFMIAALLALPGCAQTMWVKPGASPQEHAVAHLQCDVFASQSTTRQPIYGSRPGTVIASAIVAGIAEGIEQASWKTRCMQAHGFANVPIQPPPAVVIATSQSVPAVESQTEAKAQIVKASVERTVPQELPAPSNQVAVAPLPATAIGKKCTAYTYAEYLQQKHVCDVENAGG